MQLNHNIISQGNSRPNLQKKPCSIDSSAVFVTTNGALTTVSNDFFFKSNDNSIAPPCVTDFFLTNLLWLKTPNRAPDLPMKRIIADSYAAIQPDEKLMARWISEIEKLETGEQLRKKTIISYGQAMKCIVR